MAEFAEMVEMLLLKLFESLNEFKLNNKFFFLKIFDEMDVHFSIGGKIYSGEPIVYRPLEDRIFENSRNISVKLHHRVGKFVKLRLHFSARWILISEISFRSGPWCSIGRFPFNSSFA